MGQEPLGLGDVCNAVRISTSQSSNVKEAVRCHLLNKTGGIDFERRG